jgi:four helix bundle protein
MERVEQLKKRTMDFALQVVRLVQGLPASTESWVLGKQLLRSATSVGANYRAACRARSDAEFFHKICIVVEEIDETDYWLDLIDAAGLIKDFNIREIQTETLELIKIFATIKAKSKP